MKIYCIVNVCVCVCVCMCVYSAMEAAADQFYGVLENIGQKAANLPGSIRKLGMTSHSS